MATGLQKRSQRVQLLLFGAVTLVSSSCQGAPDPLPDDLNPYSTEPYRTGGTSPLYASEAECVAHWGEGNCTSVESDSTETPPSTTQEETANAVDETYQQTVPFPTQVVGWIGRRVTYGFPSQRPYRGGFGGSALHYGGAYS